MVWQGPRPGQPSRSPPFRLALRAVFVEGVAYISHILRHLRLALALSVCSRGRLTEPPPWPQAPRARGCAVMERAESRLFRGPQALRARGLVAFGLCALRAGAVSLAVLVPLPRPRSPTRLRGIASLPAISRVRSR